MQIYDYVKYTGDVSILNTVINGDTLLEKAKKVIKKLSSFADETGLIYKPGNFNKRDWADVINRNGYVTYNEALYARALYCLSKLCDIVGDIESKNYFNNFELVKKAINDILWSEDKGYFINFKTNDFIEDNLSIDTCFMALYDLTSDDRALKMLNNMEKLLESKNNNEQKAGDFGVMCVYPFYKEHFESAGKSSQPYHYHNSANWPYLSSMYALAKKKYNLEYTYALESWFDYNIKRGNFTPVEYFSPVYPCGSLLQAWSGVSAFVLDEEFSKKYYD
jgi:glycogen debranching enzyme